MEARPLLVLAALAAATSPDFGKTSLEDFKGKLRDRVAKDPMGSVIGTVLVGSYLFYRAEKGHNPKCNTFYDALVYVSTNLSVGYADIFAKTDAGKAIGTAIMTYGPALSARILDAPLPAERGASPNRDAKAGAAVVAAADREVVERLDKILAALEGLRARA